MSENSCFFKKSMVTKTNNVLFLPSIQKNQSHSVYYRSRLRVGGFSRFPQMGKWLNKSSCLLSSDSGHHHMELKWLRQEIGLLYWFLVFVLIASKEGHSVLFLWKMQILLVLGGLKTLYTRNHCEINSTIKFCSYILYNYTTSHGSLLLGSKRSNNNNI